MWGGSTAPSGWVLCDGQTGLSTTTYAALFAVIGYTYGGGSGTFYTPDMRSRFPMGKGAFNNTLGGSDGRADNGLGSGRGPIHTHGINDTVLADSQNTSTGGSAGRLQGSAGNITHNHGGNTHNSDGGAIPYMVLNFIIKT